jgi:hypothetical protein
MLDVQTVAILAAIVGAVALALYVWDRRTKQAPVDMVDAAKMTVGAGAIAGGVAYAVGTDAASEVVETATAAVQEMFVGKPGF